MHLFHDPQCARYSTPGHVERPSRVTGAATLLRARHPDWKWTIPAIADEETLRLVHPRAHLARLQSPPDFDSDTPFLEGIYDHARRSVGGAVAAMNAARAGEKTFSLMRPPGHHATQNRAMGFCYLNSIAIAAIAGRRAGAERVAVYDFDAHHGNGTEAILRGQAGLLFVSVHQYPGYPGTGATSLENCRNWPVPPGSPRDQHRAALEMAWREVIQFDPDLVLLSAGFDAYSGDPITQMTLEPDDFAEIGRWVAQSGIAAAGILEGGYSDDLPELIDAFLVGWNS